MSFYASIRMDIMHARIPCIITCMEFSYYQCIAWHDIITKWPSLYPSIVDATRCSRQCGVCVGVCRCVSVCALWATHKSQLTGAAFS